MMTANKLAILIKLNEVLRTIMIFFVAIALLLPYLDESHPTIATLKGIGYFKVLVFPMALVAFSHFLLSYYYDKTSFKKYYQGKNPVVMLLAFAVFVFFIGKILNWF